MAQRRTRARKTQTRKTQARKAASAGSAARKKTPVRKKATAHKKVAAHTKAAARKAPARRAGGPPPIAIRSWIPIEPAFRDRVRAQLERKLRKFARHVERVSVRFQDVNGPRGGVDTVCRAKAVLRRLPTVVVEERGANEHAAFQAVTRGLERAVRREVERVVARRKRTAQAK